jgi:hypothetical protein
MLLEAYFWLMLVYAVATLVATPFMLKKGAPMSQFSRGAWVEQVAGYLLLGVGLLGVYGYNHTVPILVAEFWQLFLVSFVIFAALQHRMPKTQQLRASHGSRAVIVATVIGVLMLAPMFIALGLYAFSSPALWAAA